MRAALWARDLPGLVAPPYVLTRMAAFVGLSGALALRLWRAWKQAETPLAVELRQHLLFFDERKAQRSQDRDIIQQVCSGKALTLICEALVDEHLLSRTDATAIEEAILSAMDAKGAWRG